MIVLSDFNGGQTVFLEGGVPETFANVAFIQLQDTNPVNVNKGPITVSNQGMKLGEENPRSISWSSGQTITIRSEKRTKVWIGFTATVTVVDPLTELTPEEFGQRMLDAIVPNNGNRGVFEISPAGIISLIELEQNVIENPIDQLDQTDIENILGD